MPTSCSKFDRDGDKFGELHISKGTIDWYPLNAKIPTKLTWKQFDSSHA